MRDDSLRYGWTVEWMSLQAGDLRFNEHYDGWCGMMHSDRGERFREWIMMMDYDDYNDANDEDDEANQDKEALCMTDDDRSWR